ncbi:MAG: GNAT family N-acetyltransferase [Chloroflexota bacterium]
MAEATPPIASVIDVHMPVTIRTVRRDDLAALEMDGLFIKFRNLFRRAYREQRNGRRLLLMADSNGHAVGRLFILFVSSDHSIADGRHRAYLYSFFVLSAFRGHGIGTHMVQYAEEFLRERGFRYATIAVAKDNGGALRLYERLGYTHVREDPGKWSYTDHLGKTHRVHEPCWILEKIL